MEHTIMNYVYNKLTLIWNEDLFLWVTFEGVCNVIDGGYL